MERTAPHRRSGDLLGSLNAPSPEEVQRLQQETGEPPSACLSAWLSSCLSACLSACLLICLPVSLSICLSVCLSACLPVCLSACLSAYLSAYLGQGQGYGYPVCLPHPCDFLSLSPPSMLPSVLVCLVSFSLVCVSSSVVHGRVHLDGPADGRPAEPVSLPDRGDTFCSS